MKLRLAPPRPAEVPQRLLPAGAREIIHHRSTEMERLIHENSGGLPPLFGTNAPVYTIASSGTGAMEAAVANCFSAGDEVLVVSNGCFGELWLSAGSFGLSSHSPRRACAASTGASSPWGAVPRPQWHRC